LSQVYVPFPLLGIVKRISCVLLRPSLTFLSKISPISLGLGTTVLGPWQQGRRDSIDLGTNNKMAQLSS
jgi:hypothetical protein